MLVNISLFIGFLIGGIIAMSFAIAYVAFDSSKSTNILCAMLAIVLFTGATLNLCLFVEKRNIDRSLTQEKQQIENYKKLYGSRNAYAINDQIQKFNDKLANIQFKAIKDPQYYGNTEEILKIEEIERIGE